MMLKILTAAALVATANGAVTKWNQANGMCVGIDQGTPGDHHGQPSVACTDMASCTTTGVGPCAANETAPKWHITSEFVALAFTAPGYLTDAKQMKQITPATSAQQGGGVNGFRDYFDKANMHGGQFIYSATGGIFGGDDTAWGYASIASYLNSGKKDIVTNENKFYNGARLYNPTKKGTMVMRFDGSLLVNVDGVPAEPEKDRRYREKMVCVTELKAGKCGDKVAFKPGDYKFSIFGATRGADWAAKTKGGQNGFPADQSHMGVRMKVTAHGIAFDNVTVNGNVDVSAIGETDVTTLTLTQTGGSQLTYTFPKNFNVGDYNTMVADAAKKPQATTVGTASGNVVIHVSKESANTLNIDYLFPLTVVGATADKYFVYDPTINYKDPPAATTATKAAAATTKAADAATTKAAAATTTAKVVVTGVPAGAATAAASAVAATATAVAFLAM